VPILECRDLRKTFPGGVEAVCGVSFEIAEGEVFGLLGPNGAGKTTTMRMLGTLLSPTSVRRGVPRRRRGRRDNAAAGGAGVPALAADVAG